ncbi:uroporphyrinogen-III synthase [Salinisphaera sp. SPP-AMP-43]|uniref:uroporphyrinogen-III synthase n=1 Tax=Salinisphaera sp. SPP-AMP-43 TaxID=3121288 RepID=UPI003C6E40B9
MAEPDLSGCTVWLTRPAERAEPWRQALIAAGAKVVVEPLLCIAPPDDEPAAAAGLARAEQADCVIATSANAVAGIARLRPGWCPRGRLIAVGTATAEALVEQTGKRVATPATSNSEGLLAMPELAEVADRRIAVLAGHGGRAELADTLAARGAQIDKIALYRRCSAAIAPARIDELIGGADALVITSSESWQNLSERLTADQRRALGRLGLVAASRRVVQQAGYDIDWSVEPVVIERMDASGAVIALDRIWSARRQ